MKMTEHVEELARRKAKAAEMGGAERVQRQRSRGKLDARARLQPLFDAGTFEEFGALAADAGQLPEEMDASKPSPADGVITGVGEIDGRPVAAVIYDFTVFGGSISEIGERKVTRLRDLALKNRIPMVWLIDSAGARIEAGAGVDARRIASFADTGYLFREQVVMSGVVPQVAAMVGPGAAGTAYIPGLADFVPMVKGTCSIAIGGPYLVESVVGEKVTRRRAGRLEGAQRGLGRGRRRVRRRRRVPGGDSRVPVASSPRTAASRLRASPRKTRSTGATRTCSRWCRRTRGRRSTCTR